MYNFLLVGHGGSHNRGAEAIIRTTINLLNEEFNFPRIHIVSIDFHNEKRINFGPNVRIVPNFFVFRAKNNWNSLEFFLDILRFLRNKIRYLYFISYFRNADIVLSVGGDNFTSDYGFPVTFLNFNNLAKKFHKKLVIWAASIGPFVEY
ncbi:MAG: polysaccharide pyruvyl transferase family protein, partial [Candidatus Omnitrophota bacterium]